MAFIHKSNKDGGNIGPSIHFLHRYVKSLDVLKPGSYYEACKVGFSFRWPRDEDTFLEIAVFFYFVRLWFYIRSRACYLRTLGSEYPCRFLFDIRKFPKAEIEEQEVQHDHP